MRNAYMIGALLMAGCGSAATGATESEVAVASGDEVASSRDEAASSTTETTEGSQPAAAEEVVVWEREEPNHRTQTRTGAFAVLERIELRGPMPMDRARRVVHRGVVNEMRPCYQQGLDRSPDLEGTVVLHLQVAADGSVVSVEEGESDLADPEVAACARRPAAEWTFGQIDRPTSIELRARFTRTIMRRVIPPGERFDM